MGFVKLSSDSQRMSLWDFFKIIVFALVWGALWVTGFLLFAYLFMLIGTILI